MVLLIDGNYFAQRIRNGCELKFISNPEEDKAALIEAAATSLAAEIRALDGVLDGVMIARDYSSWRKQVEPVQPETPLARVKGKNYKDNRDEIEKDYDPVAFYAAYDQFCDLCEEKLNIPIIKTKGCEADDIIFILSRILEKQGHEVLCWSSDGDYLHIINEKVFYLKFPKRDLHLPIGLGNKSPKSMMDVFNSAAPSRSKLLLENMQDANIKETNPAHSLLVKVVYGDEKDNVPPLFTFWSKNKKVQYRPSEAKIKKALVNAGFEWDGISKEFLYDEDDIKKFLKELVLVCKQEGVLNEDRLYKIFVSNRNLKHLSGKEIPKDLIASVVQIYNAKRSLKPDLTLCSDFQKILEKFGKIESGSYFAGLNLQ
jgi:5'-3' exonuclease